MFSIIFNLFHQFFMIFRFIIYLKKLKGRHFVSKKKLVKNNILKNLSNLSNLDFFVCFRKYHPFLNKGSSNRETLYSLQPVVPAFQIRDTQRSSCSPRSPPFAKARLLLLRGEGRYQRRSL